MARLCYTTRCYRGISSSGNKARTDNEDIISSMGGVTLGLKRSFHGSKILTFILNLAGVVKYLFSVRPGDIVLLQYPIKKYFSLICSVARLRGARTVTIIHDLGSFRRKKLTPQKEIGRLMHTDYVIASNSVMQSWIQEHGFTKMTGAIELFDYHSSTDNAGRTDYRQGHARVVYAGALSVRKTSFLLDIHKYINSWRLHIYGNRTGLPGLPHSDRLLFHDFAPPEEFISSVDADFGLVWDGHSLDECTGDFGEYLRYNTPHKVSFYIRAGLPVIIWKEAALAGIVEREHIGICIGSLKELDRVLDGITPEDYSEMCRNVGRICERFRNGWYLKQSVTEACRRLGVEDWDGRRQ